MIKETTPAGGAGKSKTAEASKKKAEPRMSERLEKAMKRVAIVANVDGERQAVADRKRREAMAATFDGWLEALDETARDEALFGLMVEATNTNRRRIATHPLCEAETAKRAEAEVARRAAEEAEEAEKAEAAQAAGEAEQDGDAGEAEKAA